MSVVGSTPSAPVAPEAHHAHEVVPEDAEAPKVADEEAPTVVLKSTGKVASDVAVHAGPADEEAPQVADEEAPTVALKSTGKVASDVAVHAGPTGRQWAWYIWSRFREQLISVSVISGYLLIFYIAMARKVPEGSVFLGLGAVCVGIALFMEGFMSGIMPLAEILGQGIPDKFSFGGAMATTFLLGIVCTLAEPAMGALELAGQNVLPEKAPILWYLLNAWNLYVFLAVGFGVGCAALVGTARLLRGWRLKILIYLSCGGSIILTIIVELLDLSEIVGMAWDCGAVTTGAVTVPIILGLGVGILTTDRKRRNSNEEGSPLDSFGIVTLASLYPIMCVLLLGIICKGAVSKEEVLEEASRAALRKVVDDTGVHEKSPLAEILYATRAVVPLILVVVGLVKFVMRQDLPRVTVNIKDVKYTALGQTEEEKGGEGKVQLHCMVGILEAYLGLILFNIGLKYGQGPLGDQVGKASVAFFSEVEGVPDSPIVSDRGVGIFCVVVFTFFMALTATYAEPALNAMGMTIEELSSGSFKKSILLFAVAVGVGGGVALGTLRMVNEWSLSVMLSIGYALAMALTTTSSIEFVSVAWDSAGVTTSSITVPLVLAMGLGLGKELQVQDAFGLLAMGSVGPIVSVLIAGYCVQLRDHMRARALAKAVLREPSHE